MSVSGTNFGSAADDYGRFRAGFPDSIFERLSRYGVGLKGQAVIDLGTGTGTLARGFAMRGCRVTGVDPDGRMIAQARQRDLEAGVNIRYCLTHAENTGLEDHRADVVSAGQCWHWFDQTRAAAEVKRILKPGGLLVIAHFDWLPVDGNMVEATEKLIQRYSPEWDFGGRSGLHPQWLPELGRAGMQNIETFSYDLDVPYTQEAWRGRVRASAGIVALDADRTRAFDADLANLLSARYAADAVMPVPHRIFAIIAQSPQADARD